MNKLLWYHVVVFPSISHFEHKLLPQMSNSTESSMTVIDDAHTNCKAGGQAAQRSRLKLTKHFLKFHSSQLYNNIMLISHKYIKKFYVKISGSTKIF